MVKIVGCLIGIVILVATGYAFLQPNGKKSTQASVNSNTPPNRIQKSTQGKPLQVIGSSTVNLGAIPKGTEKKHTFEIRNPNSFPVQLLNATSSCKCTSARIINSEIAPGGIGAVEVEYSANASPGSIQQSINIESDLAGGNQLTLKIMARIEGGIVLVPDILEVHEKDGRFLSKGTLFRFAETADKEVDFSWSDESRSSLIKINRAERACTQSESSLYFGASNAIDFEIVFLEDYPHGKIDSSLRVQIDKQHDTLHAVRGAIGIDWSWIAGPNFDEGRKLLRIGRVRKGEKKGTSLLLAIRTDSEVAPKINANPSDDAPILVEIGKPTRRGKRFLYSVELTIPSDANEWWSQHLDRNLTATINFAGDDDALSSIPLRYEFSWE